jgi:hypothetical protein
VDHRLVRPAQSRWQCPQAPCARTNSGTVRVSSTKSRCRRAGVGVTQRASTVVRPTAPAPGGRPPSWGASEHLILHNPRNAGVSIRIENDPPDREIDISQQPIRRYACRPAPWYAGQRHWPSGWLWCEPSVRCWPLEVLQVAGSGGVRHGTARQDAASPPKAIGRPAVPTDRPPAPKVKVWPWRRRRGVAARRPPPRRKACGGRGRRA